MKILVFCCKGFETMEFSPLIDVFGWARNDYGLPTQTVTCGFTQTVVSTFGVPVLMDTTIDQIRIDDYDALAIPGGFEEYGFYEEAYNERFSDLIRRFHEQNKPIASICVGALPIAKSGILRGRRATTYHLSGGHRQKQLAAFGAEVVNERIVIDENIITSYCPETAVHVAFALLKMLCGGQAEQTVRYAMGY